MEIAHLLLIGFFAADRVDALLAKGSDEGVLPDKCPVDPQGVDVT